MTLQFVSPAETPAPLKALLYGQPGSGKSCAACSAPGPILYVNCEGPDALTFARRMYGDDKIHEVAFAGKQTLIDVYLHLKSPDATEQTVVVDSIGEMYRMLLEEIGGERATLQNFGDVNTIIERFCRSLRDLPQHVVLVAHEEIADVEGEIVRRPVTGGKKLPEVLMAMMSVVAYCGVVSKDGEPRRYVGQLVQANGRRAKDRSDTLGKSRDLDLTEWIAQMRGEALPAAEETPELAGATA
jgi:adenosyl cobinamide kinase/adenosyl cobinamide phosphate guanylyltransferase